ncbi:MAG: hypothetical protein LDL33_07055 [Desulfomonile sp.]|nr:hypothetical protein [Desulfomonile sp.]
MTTNIKRLLLYTHNSIGLGHAFRTLALITGIRKWRPDIDFLVISSSSIPQIFFNEGIEVIKLPSVKLDIDSDCNRMCPRYLTDFDLETVFEFRQRLILETFDFFKPDALVVEHNMTGQMSELIPLLMKKWMRKGGQGDFGLVHLNRGIMRWVPLLQIPYENPRHRSESINIGELYDFMYVLEDREVIDINKAFLGNDPELEKKIRYLGKITNKVYDELPGREAVLSRFGLPDRPIVLISLGRNHRVAALSIRLMECLKQMDLLDKYQVVMVLDPYLDGDTKRALCAHPLSAKVEMRCFVPDLVDLLSHADLVVSRAGYNIFNEVLLTGAKAVLIPESHGGGEQEQRVRSAPRENILVLTEDEALLPGAEAAIFDLLEQQSCRPPQKFDKYAIGRVVIDELEEWAANERGHSATEAGALSKM